jgi:hypothetical protein
MNEGNKITQDFRLNGNGTGSLPNISNAFKYATIMNNTPYSVVLRGSGEVIFTFPVYSILTIPISNKILQSSALVNYDFAWTGTTAATLTVIFSEQNLGLNQTLITPGGGSTVIIAGDSVGLAKGSQLPTTLVAGALGVNVTNALSMTLGAALPAGTNNIGDVDVLSLPALPAGSNIVGNVRVDQTTPGTTNGVVLNAGSNIVGNVRVDQTTPGTTNGVVVNSLTAVTVGQNLKPATTPTVYNIAMATANTEYSQALPANTKKFTIGLIENDTAFRLAFATGKVATPTAPYTQWPAGGYYCEDEILATPTIYAACGIAGKNLQIIAWS